jgi:hypothetical protein
MIIAHADRCRDILPEARAENTYVNYNCLRSRSFLTLSRTIFILDSRPPVRHIIDEKSIVKWLEHVATKQGLKRIREVDILYPRVSS